jgi:diguanylate cyclase (GGDEF)-like protein
MFHALERDFNSNVAQTRARLLSNMFELEHSKSEAELARLEADVLRAQSAALAAEKRALEIRADELGRHANQDPLTGLWNRRYLDGRLAALFAARHAPNRALCIAACDIDHFKSINDRFGHATGDAVLVRVARLLTGGTRPSDLVARIGGEEFMLVFPDSDIAATAAACERLRVAIALHAWADLVPDLAVTISIGVTCCGAAADLPAALRQADELLYQAKQNGRNLVRVAGTPVQ